MSGKPSSQTDKAVSWLKIERTRTLKQAVKLFSVSRMSILVQLGQEFLKKRK